MPGGDQGQKTEQPTAKKLADARNKGQIPLAPEMRHATMFVGAMIVCGGMGAWTLARVGSLCVGLWGRADDYALDPSGARDLMIGIAHRFLVAVAPLAGVLLALALLPLVLQGKPTLTWSRVAPNWSKLSPIAGAARLFGKPALVEFAKSLAKIIAIATVAFLVATPHLVALDVLIGMAPIGIATTAATLVFKLVRAIGIMVMALAAFDFVYQRRAFIRRLMMTRQEVQDEHKQSDGDPKIKARIRSIRLMRSRKRMMAAVPTASVVITNPTHYAVALRYDHGTMAAPVVVAKGMDTLALRIREAATQANVPIVENPPLARALYASADLDRPIPVEQYAAVAEVISYVLRLARQLN